MAHRSLTPDDARAAKLRAHHVQRLMVRRSLQGIARRAMEHAAWLREIDWKLDEIERAIDAMAPQPPRSIARPMRVSRG